MSQGDNSFVLFGILCNDCSCTVRRGIVDGIDFVNIVRYRLKSVPDKQFLFICRNNDCNCMVFIDSFLLLICLLCRFKAAHDCMCLAPILFIPDNICPGKPRNLSSSVM